MHFVFYRTSDVFAAEEILQERGLSTAIDPTPVQDKLDTVYILGDLIFRASNAPEYYLDRLKGRKHLILGNHDKHWVSKVELSRYFRLLASVMATSLVLGRNIFCIAYLTISFLLVL